MGRISRLLAVAIFAVSGAVPAAAHGTGPGEDPSGAYPSDGAVLASPPREVHLPAPSQAGWVLELRSADGRQIPFTGQTVDQGSVVSASPPYLAAGTYLLGWGTGSGFSAVVSFSVGAPSASVTVQPSAIDRPAGLVAAVCLMVAAACAGMWAIAGRRRLVFRTAGSLLAFLGGLCAWASQAAPGVWVTAGAAVLLGFSVWLPRSGMRLTLAVASVPGALAISPPEAPGGPGGVLAITFGILGAGLAVMFAGMLARRLAASGASESAPPADREPDLSVLAAHEGMWIRLLVALLFTVLVPFWMMFGSGVSGGFVTAAAVLSVLLFAGLAIPTLVVAAARTATGRAAGIWLERTAIAAVLALLVGIAGVGVADTTEIELLAGDVPPPASCLVDKNRLETHRCLETVYTAVVNSEGVTSALENLQQLVAGQPRARFFCHDASHAIGRTALETSGSVSEAFQSGFDVCDFGFYHGIVEGAAAHLDDDAFRAAVPNLCVELEPLGRLFVYQCTHGLGHAAARRTNNDMVRALGFCEALDTMPGIRPEELDGVLNGCGTGVTMEWFAVATSAGIDAVAPAVGEVREVCDAVPDRWLPECLEYVGNTLDTSNPVESLKELAGWCATTRDRGSCMIGLARAAGGVGVDPRSVFAVCDLGGETRDTCVRYFIAGVATTVEYRVEAVDELCALLPESDRDGPGSLCAGVRSSVEDILSAGDGRPDAQPGGSQRSP